MKKIVLILICLVVMAGQTYANMPNYLSDTEVPLSEKEQEALRLAAEWQNKPVKPVHLGNGKVVYVYGASEPSVVAVPMLISDIELEAGELVQDILVGDSQRWLVETGASGTVRGTVEHVFVKPIDAGLVTSLVITTNRRVYHIKLISRKSGHTPYISFLYPEQALAIKRQAQKQQEWQIAHVNNTSVDMGGLNFNYKIQGRAAWRPTQVYDNGRQLYIKLSERVSMGEIPVLLVMHGSQETLVNYRYNNHTFEVDGVFDKIVLISGVGRQQEKITISRED